MVDGRLGVLMIGDVVGEPGIKALVAGLGELSRRLGADLVVANGENSAGGLGIGKEELDRLLGLGVQAVTSGNHVWEKKGATELLDAEPKLLRPANYPPGVPGHGWLVLETGGATWAVVNLQGRESLYHIDCPFRVADAILAEIESVNPGALVVVDFHAESNEEKEALALHLDGRVVAFAGTHTHVQTADERILPKGTGYLTDMGMTGPVDSVIGVKAEICLRRSLTQIPIKMETAEGPAEIRGVFFLVDPASRRCVEVRRIRA